MSAYDTVNPLASLWRAALSSLVVRHPNGRSNCVLRVLDGDQPQLYVDHDDTVRMVCR